MRSCLILLLLVTYFLISCKDQKISDEIIIEGNVKEIPDGKVYLTEAHRWMTPLDSTTVTKGHFVFTIKPGADFYPYMASIYFPDSLSWSKLSGLIFENEYVLPPDTASFHHYGNSGFYLEKGITLINGDPDEKAWRTENKAKFIKVKIKAGKETEVMYRNDFTDFGWLGNVDSGKRDTRIRFFKKEITRYPFSYFLLDGIFNGRGQYSKEELKDFLSRFDKDVQTSPLAEKVRTYLANRPDPTDPDINLSLSDINNVRREIINKDSKLNILVFWASWCGPCRQEIPTLKEIYERYKNEGINMVSISIDTDQLLWQKAIKKETMNWRQCIVDSNKIDLVQTQYNFSAIPMIVLTDGYGKEIKRFSGFEPDNKELYLKAIDEALAKK